MRTQLTPDELSGWAIRSAREFRGLKIGQLADQLGWHRNTLSDVETGERHAKPIELKGIAAQLNWPVQWLQAPPTPDDMGGTTTDGNADYHAIAAIFATAEGVAA